MTPRTKSTLLILGTLVIGMVLGALFAGAFMRHRLNALAELRTRAGLTEALIHAIEPTDAAQEAALRDVLEDGTDRILAVRRAYRRNTRAAVDSLRAELAPILTDEQKARLRRRIGTIRERRQGRQRE